MNNTEKMHYRIIVNPQASRGAAALEIPTISAQLKAAGLDFSLVETSSAKQATDLARQAALDDIPVVVAMGGDGILNEVLNGLMQARAQGHDRSAMGLIPVGRGNDFAYGAGIPENALDACQVLIANQRKRIDIGLVKGGDYPDGLYFGNGIGIGFDAVVGFEALKMTWLTGFASYVVAAFKTILVYYKAPLLRLDFGSVSMELRCQLLSVMLGRRMGGGFHMAPHSQNNDGQFDLLIGQKQTKPGVFKLIPRFMKGTQFNTPGIIGARCAQLSVTALQGSIPAHADGETICIEGARLEISLEKQAIDLICDPALPVLLPGAGLQ